MHATKYPSSKQRYKAFREFFKKQGRKIDPRYTSASSTEAGAQPGKQDYFSEYLKWLKPFTVSLIAVFMLALVIMGMDLILPIVTRYVIDNVLLADELPRDRRISLLMFISIGMLLLLIITEIIRSIRAYLMSVLNAKFVFRLRKKLLARLLRLPLSDIYDMKTGGVVSRLSGDVDSIRGIIQMALITPGTAVIRLAVIMGILFYISWKLSFVALAMIPPIIVISLIWINKLRPIFRSMRGDRAEVDGRVAETFGGIRVIRTFRREPKEEMEYAIGHHTVIRKTLFAQVIQIFVMGGWEFITPATVLAIMWFGGYLVIDNLASVGDIVAFQMYTAMLFRPIMQIMRSLTDTQRGLAAMERVYTVLQMPAEKPDIPYAIEAPLPVNEIRIENVSFAYNHTITVLKNINLTIPGGSVIALVGPSGAGKTTFVDLIARFHDPSSGAILLNGTDLRHIRLHSYRKLLGIVQQEIFLFDGTVTENIAYGRRGARDEEIVAAAQQANAHSFIEQLPNGYNTIIGERGVKLSGGQRQRISIARAVLANPHILILDEATSNLDTESEEMIQTSLDELMVGRTTIVIAHRLSTITGADLIVVLNEGNIIEHGTHEDLMALHGKYHEMYSRQIKLQTESMKPF